MTRLAAIGLLAMSVAGVACQRGAGSIARPVLRIATDATFAPFHFRDASGRATGFDVELARAVAERAGFAPEVVVRPYDELLAGLPAGAHDLVAATTGITPEREALYLFTQPYFETCQAALVRAGSGEPTSVGELRGRRVGASGAGTAFRAMQGITGAAPVTLGKGQEGVPSLERRAIDALVLDEFDAVSAARESAGRLKVLSEPVAMELYAFVLRKDRTAWKASLDRALAELEREGRVGELRVTFGVARDEAWPVELVRRSGPGPSSDYRSPP
jgi:ABC-type amino acid transport substrate-binding protein